LTCADPVAPKTTNAPLAASVARICFIVVLPCGCRLSNLVRVDEPATDPTPITIVAIGRQSVRRIAAEGFAESLIFP
jgi:hypothetical protein